MISFIVLSPHLPCPPCLPYLPCLSTPHSLKSKIRFSQIPILPIINLDSKRWELIPMGFADLSIAEIAADYNVPVEDVLNLCDQLGIAYKHPQTRLALEDAKAIMSKITAQQLSSESSQSS